MTTSCEMRTYTFDVKKNRNPLRHHHYKKVDDQSIQESTTTKEVQDFIRQEVERQTSGILKKTLAAAKASEEFELLEDAQAKHQDPATTEIHETTVLLDSYDDDPNNSTTTENQNRLETTADSLLDVRVDHLKRNVRDEEARRLVEYNRRSTIRSDLGADYTRSTDAEVHDGGSSRTELYCCYTMYFFMVFAVFYFALFHVWGPMARNVAYGKPPKPNASSHVNVNSNHYRYNNF